MGDNDDRVRKLPFERRTKSRVRLLIAVDRDNESRSRYGFRQDGIMKRRRIVCVDDAILSREKVTQRPGSPRDRSRSQHSHRNASIAQLLFERSAAQRKDSDPMACGFLGRGKPQDDLFHPADLQARNSVDDNERFPLP